MKLWRIVFLLIFLAGLWGQSFSAAQAATSLALYGTFQAMGVIVTLAGTDDPDRDATATVEYRLSGSGPYHQGFPLTRVADTRFVGSLFWLQPGTSYDVRVTFNDPDGGPLHGSTVTGSATTRAEIVIPSPNNSYYVSPAGNGTTCTVATPCVLTEGLSQAQAGDEVILRDGVYYQGEMSLPRSGAAGAPIVIRSYPGETTVLDGADPVSFFWTHQGSGVYQTTVNTADTHLVTANGQRLLPYDNLTDLQTLSRDNTPGHYTSGTTLYVHLAGNADPNSTAMVVSRYNYAFTVEQDYIYFLDLTFRHYGQGTYAKALYFNNANDNLVQGCTFASNDLGIGLKRVSHRNVFQDNEFYDTIFNWPWADIKELGGLEDGGIRFYDPVDGRGTIIRRNTFHDDFDGFGVCPASTAALTNETDVYDNLAYNLGDDGIETDGTCRNVRLWGNTFHDVLVGISLAPVYDGPLYALRNLIYRTGAGNNNYGGTPFKFNSGYDQSGPMYLFHNTSDAVLVDNNGLDIKSPGSWQMIYGRNNIWAGTIYALSNANPSQPLDLDYDDLYTTLPGELAWWSGLPDRHLNTLSELQTATGQEHHGFNIEPGFANAAGGDYSLDSHSDLIDEGLLIPGINSDYTGGAPDIGAFEFTPALDLSGRAADQSIHLSWSVNTTLPPTSTWQISYTPPGGVPPSPVTDIISPTRVYTLSGLSNGTWYTVTLNAMLNNAPFLTDSVTLMPTDIFVYLPLVLKQ